MLQFYIYSSIFLFQSQHWPCVRRLAHTVGLSALDALKIEHDESETVTAMAGLSMQSMNRYIVLN